MSCERQQHQILDPRAERSAALPCLMNAGADSDNEGPPQASSSAFSSGIAPFTLAQSRPTRSLKKAERTPKQVLLGQFFKAKTYPPAMRRIEQMLGRWNDSQRVLEEAKAYLKSKGGNADASSGSGSYAMPGDWANDPDLVKQGLAHYTFDQKELLAAVNIGNTSHNNDAKLFLEKHATGLKYDSEAVRFINGDETLEPVVRSLLNDFTKAEWEARLAKKKEKEKKRRAEEKKKGKKAAADAEDSPDDDDEPPRKRSKKGKKKAKATHSSSELDSD
ncbi:hypothetical protein C8F01DRAFT_1094374 [Mycena amicta]|nr:hypothetical protein C8F01DRAFT_1094374 [Mycena amicta]